MTVADPTGPGGVAMQGLYPYTTALRMSSLIAPTRAEGLRGTRQDEQDGQDGRRNRS